MSFTIPTRGDSNYFALVVYQAGFGGSCRNIESEKKEHGYLSIIERRGGVQP